MNKKNKADFIDEEEFLSAVSMNKKGGCVRMGKPPQETDNTPHETVPSEDNETLSQDQKDVSLKSATIIQYTIKGRFMSR